MKNRSSRNLRSMEEGGEVRIFRSLFSLKLANSVFWLVLFDCFEGGPSTFLEMLCLFFFIGTTLSLSFVEYP